MDHFIKETISPSGLFNTLNLLKAYEQAIDENIISTITDAQGIIVHANRKFCEVSQYSPSEVVGKSHKIVNSGFHSKEFFKNMWQTIGRGKVWHDEIKNRAEDGSLYWVDTVIVPIKDEQNQNTHFLSLRTLITERKELEKKKAKYVSSLEVLLVMTSSNVKKPLSQCLQQMNNFDPEKPASNNALKEIVSNLQQSAAELDTFTRELTTFIREME